MNRRRIRPEAGFGMVEVLVAVALYAIALVSLFGLLISSVTAGTIGESSAIAVNLARQRIETLAAQDVPVTLAADCVGPGNVTQQQVPAGQGRVYTLTVACNDQPSHLDVSVTARWTVTGARVSGGTQYTRVLQTRIAK